jgi:hypothetical protein
MATMGARQALSVTLALLGRSFLTSNQRPHASGPNPSATHAAYSGYLSGDVSPLSGGAFGAAFAPGWGGPSVPPPAPPARRDGKPKGATAWDDKARDQASTNAAAEKLDGLTLRVTSCGVNR